LRTAGSLGGRNGFGASLETPPYKGDSLRIDGDAFDEEVECIGPQQLVERTFRNLFPDSFLYAVPVYKHKVGPCPVLHWKMASKRHGAPSD
jgi:hypothetical protein